MILKLERWLKQRREHAILPNDSPTVSFDGGSVDDALVRDQDTFTGRGFLEGSSAPDVDANSDNAALLALQSERIWRDVMRVHNSATAIGLYQLSHSDPDSLLNGWHRVGFYGEDTVGRRGMADGISYSASTTTYYFEPLDDDEPLTQPLRNEGVANDESAAEATEHQSSGKVLKRKSAVVEDSDDEFMSPTMASATAAALTMNRNSKRQARFKIQKQLDSDSDSELSEEEEAVEEEEEEEEEEPLKKTAAQVKKISRSTAPSKATHTVGKASSSSSKPASTTRARSKLAGPKNNTTSNSAVLTASTTKEKKMKWNYRMRFVLHELFVHSTTSKDEKENIFNEIFQADLTARGITHPIDIEKMRKAESDKKRTTNQTRIIADCVKILADDATDQADDAAGVQGGAGRATRDSIRAEIVSAAVHHSITFVRT